jgi:hypothetical protein
MKKYALIFLLCAVIVGCDKSGDVSTSAENAALAQQIKETPAYALAVVEAGEELSPLDPRVKETAQILFDAAKFFNTTEKEISNIAYYHAKEARKRGINITANDLLASGMKAFPPNSPFPEPRSIAQFNLFSAMAQVTAGR